MSTNRHRLTNAKWAALAPIIAAEKAKIEPRGRKVPDMRAFVEAVLWIGKTGAPWRDLPAELGKWRTVHNRWFAWGKSGIWQAIFEACSKSADCSTIFMDSTVCKAHAAAAGARKKRKAPASPRSASA
jgi:transposase